MLFVENNRLITSLHIQPKPKGVRRDVIELNCLCAVHIDDEIVGVMNINYFEEDQSRIEEIVPLIIDVIDFALCGNYSFEVEGDHLMRVSQKLYYHNIKVGFRIPDKYYDFKVGKVITTLKD